MWILKILADRGELEQRGHFLTFHVGVINATVNNTRVVQFALELDF
jgi:hypothetical protein